MNDISNRAKTSLDQPIILLSLKRSGSTLLRHVLDAHPSIFGQALLIGPLCDAIYNSNYSALSGPSLNSVERTESERQHEAVQSTRKIITEMMAGYLNATRKLKWCDKSLRNIAHIERIDSVFPNARYICLYRHCMDFVQSYLSMTRLGFLPEVCEHVKKSPHNVVAAISEYWVEKNGLIHHFEKRNPGKCFRVNYERFVRAPEDTLRELFRVLGLEWSDGVLETAFEKSSRSIAEGDIKFHFSNQVHTDSIGSGASLPAHILPPPLQARVDALLAELGYQDQVAPGTNIERGELVATVLDRFKQRIESNADLGRSIGEPASW